MNSTFNKIVLILMLALTVMIVGCEADAFREAAREGTQEAMEEYLEEYPDGKYSDRARDVIEKMKLNKALNENTVEAYNRFLQQYPESEFYDEVKAQRDHVLKEISRNLSVEEMQEVIIRVKTTSGTFSFDLLPEAAPEHSRNIIYLSLINFYRNQRINLVAPGRMVQMGDPRGDGLGGPGYMIPMEENDLKQERGSVSMWHYPNEPDTAGSQFFITLVDMPGLDGKYTVFGKVTEGMDVLEKISESEVKGEKGRKSRTPLTPIYIENMEPVGLELN